MEFQLEPRPRGAAISGNMTVYDASDLKQALLAHTVAGQPVELDLSQVHEIDTAGLQLLLLLQRRCGVRVVACSPTVRGVLSLCHLDGLTADATPEEAA